MVFGAAEAPLEAAALEIADSTEEAASDPVAVASTEVVAVDWAAEPVMDSDPLLAAAVEEAESVAAVDEAALSVEAAAVVVSCLLTRWKGEAKAAEAPSARSAVDLKSIVDYLLTLLSVRESYSLNIYTKNGCQVGLKERKAAEASAK